MTSMAKKAKKRENRSVKDDRRARLVEEAILLVWSSLNSHLPYTYRKYSNAKGENKQFHKKCVKEYIRIIEILKEFY